MATLENKGVSNARVSNDETKTSVRVVATLPWGIYAELEQIAEKEARAVGNLAGSILEGWVRAESDKRFYCPSEIYKLLSDHLKKNELAEKHDSQATEKAKKQISFLKLLREVDKRFTAALYHPSDREVIFETARAYDVAGGLQLNEFMATLVEAGEYAPAIIPQVFERIGPLPQGDATYDPSEGPVDALTKYLIRIQRLEELPGFDTHWVSRCQLAVKESIKYVPRKEWLSNQF